MYYKFPAKFRQYIPCLRCQSKKNMIKSKKRTKVFGRKQMLAEGIKGQMTLKVSDKNTAKAMKSGTLQVFATPSMIALIEETAWKSVADELEEGCATVGTALSVRHLSATPVGMEVTCRTTLEQVDGRRLVFSIVVEDEAGMIGEGTHERFIIRSDRFQEKANAKLPQTRPEV